MRVARNSALHLMLVLAACGIATAQQKAAEDSYLHSPARKVTKRPKAALIGPDDGLAVISAALDARTRRAGNDDCSHLVHDIYQRAGLAYDYASSSDLYAGTEEF